MKTQQQHQSHVAQSIDVDLILLPGLHGSDALFASFEEELQNVSDKSELEIQTLTLHYPTDDSQSYSSLLNWLSTEIDLIKPRKQKTVILAESFSTPLALMLADRYPSIIQAVIIVGGFCSSPIVNNTAVAALSLIPLRPLFMLKPPKAAIKHYLTGNEVSPAFVKNVQDIIRKAPAKTISNRVRAILDLDESMCPNLPDTPILLLQAEDDGIIPWETQNALENHFPHADSHWIESPHFILQTHPKLAAQHILKFLEANDLK